MYDIIPLKESWPLSNLRCHILQLGVSETACFGLCFVNKYLTALLLYRTVCLHIWKQSCTKRFVLVFFNQPELFHVMLSLFCFRTWDPGMSSTVSLTLNQCPRPHKQVTCHQKLWSTTEVLLHDYSGYYISVHVDSSCLLNSMPVLSHVITCHGFSKLPIFCQH